MPHSERVIVKASAVDTKMRLLYVALLLPELTEACSLVFHCSSGQQRCPFLEDSSN